MTSSSPTCKMFFSFKYHPAVLLFQFSTTVQQLNCLKQHPFIISQICRPKVQAGRLKWVLCLGSLKAKIKVLGRLHSFLEALRKNALPFSEVFRIQSFMVVGLKSLFSCWLSARGPSQLLDVFACGHSIFKPNNTASNLSCASNHLTSFATSPTKLSAFKGLVGLDSAHLYNLPLVTPKSTDQ